MFLATNRGATNVILYSPPFTLYAKNHASRIVVIRHVGTRFSAEET